MRIFNVRKAGCNTKLPYLNLQRLVAKSRISSRAIFGNDANQCTKKLQMMTIDTVHPVVENPYIVGQMAVLHAITDLHASAVIPSDIAISLSVPENSLSNLVALMDGVADFCRKENLNFTKGHTTLSDSVSITVSAIGDRVQDRLQLDNSKRYCILLTKPIGISAVLSLANADDNNDILATVLPHALQSHLRCVPIITRASPIVFDVSGFGFIGGLCAVASVYNLRVELFLSQIPLASDEYPGLFRCQVQNNFADFMPMLLPSDYDIEKISSLLFASENCGALVMFVKEELIQDALKNIKCLGFNSCQIVGRATLEEFPAIIVKENDDE